MNVGIIMAASADLLINEVKKKYLNNILVQQNIPSKVMLNKIVMWENTGKLNQI